MIRHRDAMCDAQKRNDKREIGMINALNDTQIEQLGYDHAIEAIRDSGSPSAPYDGWDSWLINGVGFSKTLELFGEPASENEQGWSDAMKRKLRLYHEGAERACEVARKS